MASTTQFVPALEFARHVEQLYVGLMAFADPDGDEPGAGGRLLYAGELDAEGRALAVAGNIAGAATLAASANPEVQKQTIRDGVVDFLVTSLDEALRILKNEIRKRETVAVCVGAEPESLEREMLERGVEPDLLGAGVGLRAEMFGGMAACVAPRGVDADSAWLAWQVHEAPAVWMRKLDAIAADGLGTGEDVARRWLRLAPRFLGRMTQNVRVLRCTPQAAQKFIADVEAQVMRGEIGVAVAIRVEEAGQTRQMEFAPAGR